MIRFLDHGCTPKGMVWHGVWLVSSTPKEGFYLTAGTEALRRSDISTELSEFLLPANYWLNRL